MPSDLLERMRRNPAADWTTSDVANVCAQHGVRCSPPTGGGSHYKVSHPSQQEILTIPRARPVKPVYIRKLVRFIDALEDAVPHPDYAVLIEPLPPGEGGGYLATVPDLPGCMSDGETREQAAHNVGDAIAAWIEEAQALGRPVPAPSARPVSALG